MKHDRMLFSHEEQIFIVRVYFETKSYRVVKQQFQKEFPDHGPLTGCSIKRLVVTFLETVITGDLPDNK